MTGFCRLQRRRAGADTTDKNIRGLGRDMRFEELAYRKGGADVCVPLHRKLTVVAGLGADARRQWIGRVLGALAGTTAGADVTLVFADGLGSRVRLARDSAGRGTVLDLETGEDRSLELADMGHVDWLSLLGLELSRARELVVMTPEDVQAPIVAGAPPSAELIEAREVLARVEEEHAAAASTNRRLDDIHRRVRDLGEEITNADEELARRRYARATSEVHRLTAELAALTGTDPIDQDALAVAREAMAAAERWQAAAELLQRATQDFGDRRRLDAKSMERARRLPADMPRGLQELHEAFLSASSERGALQEALAEQASNEMATPSAPWVVTLARCDQKDLWDRADDVLQTRGHIGQISMGLGGTGDSVTTVREIEAVHAEVDEAERAVDSTKLGPLAVKAKRRLAKAQAREQTILERAGFGSYLSFSMRRIDVLIDASTRENLQVAELEHQIATNAWAECAGDVNVDHALAKRAEIEKLARHLLFVEQSTDEVDLLRRDLEERVEPEYARALNALQDACGAFDVNAEHAVSEVAALVFEARTARLQDALDQTIAAHDDAYDELDALLSAAGHPGNSASTIAELENRIAAVQLCVMEAEVRQHDQDNMASGRDPDEVRAELERARNAASRLSRPGWPARPAPPEGPDPDLPSLRQEQADLNAEIDELRRSQPDYARLADRRNALRRRVDVLESGAGGPQLLDAQELEMYVLGRFASARRIGPESEPIPMLVDDALVDMPRTEKWRMLDLVARLGEATQVIYLTNDEDAIDWAQQRSAEGSIALVEGRDQLSSRRVG